MVKHSILQGTLGKPKLLMGILLMSLLMGLSGCSPSNATTAQATTPGQPSQGQRVRNPAQLAAMEIRRLQSNQQNALTSEQKVKIIPILQELIKTPNPSQEVLQQKADAINAVLTEQQKSFLTQRTPNGNKPNTTSPNGNNSTANSTKRNTPPGGTGTGGKQNGSTFNPQDIYQQVLDSLK